MKFGTDGVRGVAHDELTTEFAVRLARAASRVLGADGASTVVIGGDTRESTPAFDAALTAGFRAEGIDVIRLGVVPTPLVAFEAQRTGAMGAMVSASHNPFHDNGIKLFAPGGTKLPDEVEEQIEDQLDALGAEDPVAPAADDSTVVDIDGTSGYVDHVLKILEGRRLDGLRIVLDTANGAASAVAPVALREAGADVVVVSDEPDGRNINAGCGATFPQYVAAAVVEHEVDERAPVGRVQVVGHLVVTRPVSSTRWSCEVLRPGRPGARSPRRGGCVRGTPGSPARRPGAEDRAPPRRRRPADPGSSPTAGSRRCGPRTPR